jgi:hypothetical protein
MKLKQHAVESELREQASQHGQALTYIRRLHVILQAVGSPFLVFVKRLVGSLANA